MKAEIAVIGGSGLYEMSGLSKKKNVSVKTPYGVSSDIFLGSLSGHKVAFLTRHGKQHTVPPHLVNYRANIWALKKTGAERIIATTASGAINLRMKVGELALLTQFLDFTKRRDHTFYDGGKLGIAHIDFSEPYCPEIRGALLKAGRELKLKIHQKATYACTEGPRFETPAEIRAYGKLGADLVGMTTVPECVLARELGMCYAAIGIVTNVGAGLSEEKLDHACIIELMKDKLELVKKLIVEAIKEIPEKKSCECTPALKISKLGFD